MVATTSSEHHQANRQQRLRPTQARAQLGAAGLHHQCDDLRLHLPWQQGQPRTLAKAGTSRLLDRLLAQLHTLHSIQSGARMQCKQPLAYLLLPERLPLPVFACRRRAFVQKSVSTSVSTPQDLVSIFERARKSECERKRARDCRCVSGNK